LSARAPRPQIRRITIAAAVLAALLLAPLPATGGALWDGGAAVGYCAGLLALLLYLYPLRGRDAHGAVLSHRRLLSISQHRQLGWVALGFATAHVVIVLTVQPLTLRYLLPSAPLYMLCGLAAWVALAALVATGLAMRKSLHAILASLFLVLLGAHLIGSGQLLDTPVKSFSGMLLLAMPLFWSAVRVARSRGFRGNRWAAALAMASGLLLLAMPHSTVTAELLEPVIARPTPLPVRFPHELHTSVNCVLCHHNFRDATGTANCIDCHRNAHRVDLDRSSEATFHVFCRTCHVERAILGEKHGPTRACEPCHR
jgi:Class III cytochrome C family